MNDLRRSAEVLFVLAVLLLASGAFAPLWTDTSAHDVIDGSPALQFVWIAIYTAVVLLLLPRWKSIVTFLAENKSFSLLIALCIFSAAWSEEPAVTLRKAFAILGTTLVGLLLALRFDLRDQIRLIAATLGIAALASLVAVLFFPTLFRPTELSGATWNGVFSHKNLLGRSMSLGTLGFLSLPRRKLLSYLLSFAGAAFCAAMLLTSHSQTALLVMAALLVLLFLIPIFRWEWRQSIGSALLMLTCCTPIVGMAIAHAGTATAFLHRDTTLTGRAKIWTFAQLSFAKRPWLGYGYGSFWWVSRESRQAIALIGYKTPHAHNAFLDLGLQLGLVGIVVFLAGWLIALMAAVRHLRGNAAHEARWPLLYLVFILLYSFTENSLLTPNSLLWILYVAAIASVAPRLLHPVQKP